jgi:hypothetical protein
MARKLQLGYQEIERRLEAMKDHRHPAERIGHHILYAFGRSERDLARYDEGKGVVNAFDGLLIKGDFCFCAAATARLSAEMERLKADPLVIQAAPKIIAVSDGITVLAYDLREHDTYENPVDRMYCDFAFFYPLMNVERAHYVEESPADIRAAEKLARLHDELRAYNEFDSERDLHDLNIFITRLLFCFFAEDTGIFAPNLFSDSIARFTKPDGSDLARYLDQSFNIMDVQLRADTTPRIITQFPYVNGGLFSKHISIPRMGAKARRIILECGDLDWKDINPDIFGSMIQAVVNPDVRAKEGMHYTSVPNIMKVINPLFMDSLRAEYARLLALYRREKELLDMSAISSRNFFDHCRPIVKGCHELRLRMSRMKFFDPACGSGNFLIITYKTLRLLEMDIIRLQEQCRSDRVMDFGNRTDITLDQFYGIELLDFPHEVAMLSLWLAQHQMDNKFNSTFGAHTQPLPLHNITQIRCGNACRVNWDEVCPHAPEDEVYVFGNPPYLGSRKQTGEQKKDMETIFGSNFGELDYISCWFLRGAEYIKNSKAKYAFVSTNSICQGVQMAILWTKILEKDLCIDFAYTSFKWTNNAKNKAQVVVIIVGVTNRKWATNKTLYIDSKAKIVDNISPLLIDGPSIFVKAQTRPLCDVPQMNFGNMAADGGNLILDKIDKDKIIEENPGIEKYIRPLVGAEELINGKQRWCFWLHGLEDRHYLDFEVIKERVRLTKEVRLKSSRPKLAATPHLFAQITQPQGMSFIIIPSVSSERRNYIPIGYLSKEYVSTNLCMVIGTNDISLFGVLTSAMHMAWVRTVGGRLKTDYRYSAGLCYNTFPFPKLSEAKRSEIEEAATTVLLTREEYPAQTLADLYDPDGMPQDLREAHQRLDDLVESCYPGYPFASDEARLECLFRLYEKMTHA